MAGLGLSTSLGYFVRVFPRPPYALDKVARLVESRRSAIGAGVCVCVCVWWVVGPGGVVWGGGAPKKGAPQKRAPKMGKSSKFW
jgi:hypothetical protein